MDRRILEHPSASSSNPTSGSNSIGINHFMAAFHRDPECTTLQMPEGNDTSRDDGGPLPRSTLLRVRIPRENELTIWMPTGLCKIG